MERIWAPWRKQYINSVVKKSKKCIFCEKSKQKRDRANYILKRSRYSFSLLNIYPYNNGHVMIAPYKHISEFDRLSKDELLDLIFLTQESKKIIDEVLKPEGYNIGANIGKISGAGFEGHFHIHIVPRWQGDTNFMPVISSTKVISESLDSLYNRIIDIQKIKKKSKNNQNM